MPPLLSGTVQPLGYQPALPDSIPSRKWTKFTSNFKS